MTPEEFERQLRGADPNATVRRGDDRDQLLDRSLQQWTKLSERRVTVRRRLSLTLAAIGIFAVASLSAHRLGMFTSDSGPRVAMESIGLQPRQQPHDDHHNARKAVGPPIEPIKEPADESTGKQSDKPTSKSAGGPDGDAAPGRDRANSDRATIDAPSPLDQQHGNDRGLANRQRMLNRQLEDLVRFVEDAGAPGDPTWLSGVHRLAVAAPANQFATVKLVPQIEDVDTRLTAMQLVCDAAGPADRTVLKDWLNQETTRRPAWDRLLPDASLAELNELIPLARSDSERVQLCTWIAKSTDPRAMDSLLHLAGESSWRRAARVSAAYLSPGHVQSLMFRMRERDVSVRTSAAFLLASVPGRHVDEVACSMITGGLYRQPAYLVLLSRNTPLARAFLTRAAAHPEFAPAFVSARLHFANIQSQLSRWINESQGVDHEPSETSQRLGPPLFRGDHHAGLVRVLRPIG